MHIPRKRSSPVLQRNACLSGQQNPESELGTSCASTERDRFQFSQPSKKREIAKRDADSQFSLPPHEVAPAGAAGAACPAAAKSG